MKSTKIFKMICLVISLAMILSVSVFAVDIADTAILFEITADNHNHDCLDDHIRDPIAAGDFDAIFGGDSFSAEAAAPCPRGCGGTTLTVCFGEYATHYYEERCFVGTHPSNCLTIQSKCYTGAICTNNCGWFDPGSATHIEAYYHKQLPDVCDPAYCSYPKRSKPASSPLDTFSAEEYVEDGHLRDPIAAGDIDNIISE